MVVVASPSRPVIWFGVVGNAAIVVLWIVTRTFGTLVGPEPTTPEPIGVADSVATAFEVVIVVAGTWLAWSVRMTLALSSRLAWLGCHARPDERRPALRTRGCAAVKRAGRPVEGKLMVKARERRRG
jgi:hypothetical protein